MYIYIHNDGVHNIYKYRGTHMYYMYNIPVVHAYIYNSIGRYCYYHRYFAVVGDYKHCKLLYTSDKRFLLRIKPSLMDFHCRGT